MVVFRLIKHNTFGCVFRKYFELIVCDVGKRVVVSYTFHFALFLYTETKICVPSFHRGAPVSHVCRGFSFVLTSDFGSSSRSFEPT